MPRLRASAFIRSTNPALLPPTVSAIAMAISFADLTTIIFMALSRVIVVPTGKPIFDGGSLSALAADEHRRIRGDRARLHRPEGDIGGHQLGDRGRVPGLGGIVLRQHRSRRFVDDDKGRRLRERRCRSQEGEERRFGSVLATWPPSDAARRPARASSSNPFLLTAPATHCKVPQRICLFLRHLPHASAFRLWMVRES